jgi:hypothetical protein
MHVPALFVLQCLAEVQPFVRQVLQDPTQYTTWPSVCAKMNNSSPTCGALTTRFGSDVNKYRRAGVLCSAMMLCSPKLASDPTCTFEDVQLLTGKQAGSSARLDLCPGQCCCTVPNRLWWLVPRFVAVAKAVHVL